MYDLVHYRSDEMPPDIACQIITYFRAIMLDWATGEDRFHDPFAHSTLFDHFLIMERGMMISHADVSFRTVTHAGETYRMACVGEVMTQSTFRHEGHGARTAAAATNFIVNSDADLAMLTTDPELEGFYNASGWVAVPDLDITHGDPGQPELTDEFLMMLFLTEKAKAHRADFERGIVYVGESLF